MLRFHGHIFDTAARCSGVCCTDAKRRLADPTQTQSIRLKFKGTMRIRWQTLRAQVKAIIVTHDLLGLKGHGLMNAAQPAIIGGGTKVQAWSRWFDMALEQSVLGRDGSVMRTFLVQASSLGSTMAQDKLSKNILSSATPHRTETIFQLAVVELQGIIEAVSQQASRAVAYGLLHNSTPMEIVRNIWDVIAKIGINRTNSMIGLLITKAHAGATLDTYEAAGITHVGLVAEGRAPIKARDVASIIRDAPRKGAGSRSRSTSGGPSKSTVNRIKQEAAAVESVFGSSNVNVVTAGDDDVCPICEDIEGDNPYTIDEARSLIPAHPDCRCTFEVADGADAGDAIDDANKVKHRKTGKFVARPGEIPKVKSHAELMRWLHKRQARLTPTATGA